MTPAEELRAAVKGIRSEASWPSEDLMLAVADWLDEVAADSHPELPAWVENAALAVARAYLGELR